MGNEKIKDKKNFINRKIETIFFVILIFVFLIGFFSGWSFNNNSLSKARINFENTQLDLRSFSYMFSFNNNFVNFKCDKNQINLILNKLHQEGISLVNLEKRRLIDTANYNLLKQKHDIDQVLFYTYYRKFHKNCNNSPNIILFFFTSKNSKNSTKQGGILNQVVKKIGSKNIIILPMDYNYTQNLDYFYNFYNFKKLPALVINYNISLIGIQNKSIIEKFLK